MRGTRAIRVFLVALAGPALLSLSDAAGAAAAPRSVPTCAAAGCHGALLEPAHRHPAAEDDCGSCHVAVPGAHPDSSRKDFKLSADGGELCGQCHDTFAGRTVHPPVAEGECLSCHDPHASAQSALLKQPLNALCFECHESEAFAVHGVVGVTLGTGHPLSGAPDPSRKGERLSCLSCHDPHATDTPRLWRFGAESTFDLCEHCHQK